MIMIITVTIIMIIIIKIRTILRKMSSLDGGSAPQFTTHQSCNPHKCQMKEVRIFLNTSFVVVKLQNCLYSFFLWLKQFFWYQSGGALRKIQGIWGQPNLCDCSLQSLSLCFHVFLLSRAWKYENLKPRSLRRRWRRWWSSSYSSSSSSSSCWSSCTGTPKSPSQEWGTRVIQEEKKLSNNKNMSGSDIKIKKVLVLKRVDLMSCWSF